MTDLRLRKQFARTQARKQDKQNYDQALIGHPDGTVYVGSERPGYVWARLNGASGRTIQVNARGFLAAYNMPVMVTHPPYRVNDWQIIDLDYGGFPGTGTGETPIPWDGANAIGPHAAQHYATGGDAVLIDFSQVSTLLVEPSSGMIVRLRQGVLPRAGADVLVSIQTLDLTANIPASGARYVLLSLDSGGALTATNGSIVAGILSLAISDVPDTPAGHFRLAAVRTFTGQASIRGSTSPSNDILDLRWPQESGALTHALLSAQHTDVTIGTVARGDVITGQGASPTWTRLALGTTGKVLYSDGIDVSWNTIPAGSIPLARGSILVGNSVGVAAAVAVGTSGAFLTNNGTDSAWSTFYLAGTAGKTLTVSESLTLAGAAGKTLTLTDSLTNQGGFAGVLSWSGAYTLTVPATLTVLGKGAAQTVTYIPRFDTINSLSNSVMYTDASNVYVPIGANELLQLGAVYQMRHTGTFYYTRLTWDGLQAFTNTNDATALNLNSAGGNIVIGQSNIYIGVTPAALTGVGRVLSIASASSASTRTRLQLGSYPAAVNGSFIDGTTHYGDSGGTGLVLGYTDTSNVQCDAITISDTGNVGIGSTLADTSHTTYTKLNIQTGGLLFTAQSASAFERALLQISPSFVVSTDASRTARATFGIFDTAIREAIRIEASGSAAMIGVLGAAAIARPAALTTQLTTLTCSAPGTPDYAIADPVQNTGYGFSTADEFLSLVKAVANQQTRLAELETNLGHTSGFGFLTK